MATTKKRIIISVSDSIDEAVSLLATRDVVPVATKVTELLSFALEIEEDTYFANMAAKRLKQKSALVSHKDAW